MRKMNALKDYILVVRTVQLASSRIQSNRWAAHADIMDVAGDLVRTLESRLKRRDD